MVLKIMTGHQEIFEAIKVVRSQIRWKPGSAMHHLRKRKSRGHLPQHAALEDYENVIFQVLHDKSAKVYRYWYDFVAYVALIAEVHDKQWLLMFTYEGILESCFVLERPERYLVKPGFEWIGLLGEVDNEL